jgi:hypothetical protein
MATITTSKQGTLNWRDLFKGLLVSGVTGALTVAEQALTTTPVVISWKAIALAGLAALIAYLLKNLFTPSQTVITPDPPPPAPKS